jgi:hydrogenase maturation protein HypF
MAEWVSEAAQITGIRRIVLAGGCFLNRVLTQSLIAELQKDGLTVLRPIRLRPGDSAISLGQAWAAAMARR